MKPGKRFGLSAEQKIDVWRRWKAGQTSEMDVLQDQLLRDVQTLQIDFHSRGRQTMQPRL